jgi:hypothetical protein
VWPGAIGAARAPFSVALSREETRTFVFPLMEKLGGPVDLLRRLGNQPATDRFVTQAIEVCEQGMLDSYDHPYAPPPAHRRRTGSSTWWLVINVIHRMATGYMPDNFYISSDAEEAWRMAKGAKCLPRPSVNNPFGMMRERAGVTFRLSKGSFSKDGSGAAVIP